LPAVEAQNVLCFDLDFGVRADIDCFSMTESLDTDAINPSKTVIHLIYKKKPALESGSGVKASTPKNIRIVADLRATGIEKRTGYSLQHPT
jgi:hypothetical protein